MLKHRMAYHEMGALVYEQHQRERELAHLQRKAAKLGFTLTAHEFVLAPAAM